MSDAQWAIRAENVSKKFGLTLKQSMQYGLRDITNKLMGRQSHSNIIREGEFWAVKDVGFELQSGDALGIMGVNGCGKTTLLRILNGVYAPDTGRIQMRGRVGALIAAGAGFAPMLSGRENVYVNGALLGLSTREIDGLMDEIVAFSELEQFIDLPVKNYSSGMYVRLGFAVAALSSPDVLLMDEVLAVGDLNFQKKCFDHILKLKEQGTAIILVSHSPGAIWSVCDRGLFINKGKIEVDGSVEDVVRAYDDQNSRNAVNADAQFNKAEKSHNDKNNNISAKKTLQMNSKKTGTGDALCTEFKVIAHDSGRKLEELGFCQPFSIEVAVTVFKPIDNFILRIVIDAVHYKNILTIDNYEQNFPIEKIEPGQYTFKIFVPEQNFRPGAYTFNVAIVSKHIGVHLFLWLKCARIVVLNSSDYFLYSDSLAVMHLNAKYTCNSVEEL